MHHKGDRKEVYGRVPVEVKRLLEAKKEELGCSSESQLIADVLCTFVGRPDLVRELGQEVLPLTA
jgi:hypothetical protein